MTITRVTAPTDEVVTLLEALDLALSGPYLPSQRHALSRALTRARVARGRARPRARLRFKSADTAQAAAIGGLATCGSAVEPPSGWWFAAGRADSRVGLPVAPCCQHRERVALVDAARGFTA